MAKLIKQLSACTTLLCASYAANATTIPLNILTINDTNKSFYDVSTKNLSSSVSMNSSDDFLLKLLGVNVASLYTASFSANQNSTFTVDVAGSNPVSKKDKDGLLSYGYTLLNITNWKTKDFISSLQKNTVIDLFEYAKVNSSKTYSLLDNNTYLYVFASNDLTAAKKGFTKDANFSLTFSSTAIAPVPEPETYALMGVGLLGLLIARRKKNQNLAAI